VLKRRDFLYDVTFISINISLIGNITFFHTFFLTKTCIKLINQRNKRAFWSHSELQLRQLWILSSVDSFLVKKKLKNYDLLILLTTLPQSLSYISSPRQSAKLFCNDCRCALCYEILLFSIYQQYKMLLIRKSNE